MQVDMQKLSHDISLDLLNYPKTDQDHHITAEELISETNTGAGQHNAITTGWIPPLCDQSLVFLDKNPNPIQTCPNMQCIACKQKTLNAFEII